MNGARSWRRRLLLATMLGCTPWRPDALQAQARTQAQTRVQAPAPTPAQSPAPRRADASARPESADQPRSAWARVTYISGAAVYLDAGTKAGLAEGSRVEVMRGSVVVAELVVAYVSSTRSSCTVVTSSAAVVVGDSARFTPPAAQVARTASPPGAAGTGTDSAGMRASVAGPRRPASRPIRGRLGVRYLTLRQDGGSATSTLTQPAFDLRLDGRNIGGTPFGIAVDVRAYRQQHARASGASLTSSTRAYQTALLWNPVNSGTRVQVGRQFSTALSPVGLFDGIAVDVDRRHVSVGAFSGSQPDPRSFGYSGDVREHGAYVQAHNAPSASASWALTAGGIGSYAGGEIDREFAYLQGSFNNRVVSLYAAQELDVNRGWKADAEGGGTTPTSTFAMLRLSPTDAVTFFGGYDNRRSIRLYRDFLTPEIAFDDSFRQGMWGGASVDVLGHVRASADARSSRGGSAGPASSYTGSLHVNRLTPLQLGVQLRATRYTGTLASGDLRAAALEMRLFGSLRLEVNGGRRSDVRASAELSNQVTTWWGGDADVGLGRSLFLMASTYREAGSVQRNQQTMLALTYRF